MMTEEENKIIEAYLLGAMTEEKVHLIERRISEDERFRESVLLQKHLFEALDENNVADYNDFSQKQIAEYEVLLRDEKTQQLKDTLSTFEYSYKKTERPTKSKIIICVAAAIAILVLLNTFFTSDINAQELYASNFNPSDIPSLIVRSNTENTGEKAQSLFENREYAKALPLFTVLSDTATSNVATLLIYKGVSEMQLDDYENARVTFNKLSQGDYVDASKGLWYNAMLSLKMGDKSIAKDYLKKIVKSSYNYKYTQAKELLEQL